MRSFVSWCRFSLSLVYLFVDDLVLDQVDHPHQPRQHVLRGLLLQLNALHWIDQRHEMGGNRSTDQLCEKRAVDIAGTVRLLKDGAEPLAILSSGARAA